MIVFKYEYMKNMTLRSLLVVVFVLTTSILSCNNADKPNQITSINPAVFSVSNLTISPVEIEYLDVVTISVTVTNGGGSSGSHDVVLYIDGCEEGVKTITVASGMSDIVTFHVNRSPYGKYEVTIEQLTGSFSVVEPWPFGE